MPKKRNRVVELAPSWETWTKPVKTAVVDVEISCKTIKKWRKMRKSTDHVISPINRRVDSHVLASLFFPSFFFISCFFFSLSLKGFFSLVGFGGKPSRLRCPSRLHTLVTGRRPQQHSSFPQGPPSTTIRQGAVSLVMSLCQEDSVFSAKSINP